MCIFGVGLRTAWPEAQLHSQGAGASSPQPEQKDLFPHGWPHLVCVRRNSCPLSSPQAPMCMSECLVDGAQVGAGGWRCAVQDRQQSDDSHLCVQLLGVQLHQVERKGVPAGTLQKQAMDVAAFTGRAAGLTHRLLHHLLRREGPGPLLFQGCPWRLSSKELLQLLLVNSALPKGSLSQISGKLGWVFWHLTS